MRDGEANASGLRSSMDDLIRDDTERALGNPLLVKIEDEDEQDEDMLHSHAVASHRWRLFMSVASSQAGTAFGTCSRHTHPACRH